MGCVYWRRPASQHNESISLMLNLKSSACLLAGMLCNVHHFGVALYAIEAGREEYYPNRES